MNISELATSAAPVQSGDTVQVDDSGRYIVTSLDEDPIACTLTGQDGTVLQLQSASDGQQAVQMGSGIPAGSYTLDCGSTTGSLVGMTGSSLDSVVNGSFQGVMWASIVGLVGIVVTIVGIVMLVRVNRRRRDIQRGAWNGGRPGQPLY